MVWRFVGGLLSQQHPKELPRFFDLFFKLDKEVIGLPERLFLIRFWGEAYEACEQQAPIKKIKQLLVEWLTSNKALIGFDYLMQTLTQYPRIVSQLKPTILAFLSSKKHRDYPKGCKIITALAPAIFPKDLPAYREVLCQRLGDEEWDVRQSATEALGLLAPHLPPEGCRGLIVPLCQRLEDEE